MACTWAGGDKVPAQELLEGVVTGTLGWASWGVAERAVMIVQSVKEWGRLYSGGGDVGQWQWPQWCLLAVAPCGRIQEV
jgi:hypothetical protein